MSVIWSTALVQTEISLKKYLIELHLIFIDIPYPQTINPTGFSNPLIFHLAPPFVLLSEMLDGFLWNLAHTDELQLNLIGL